LVLTLLFIRDVSGYVDTHPPHSLKDGPYKSLKAKPVYVWDSPEYHSADGQIRINVQKSTEEWSWDFFLQDGATVLADRHIDYSPVPFEIYHLDINGDGLKDFIVLMTYMANGISFLHERVELFLKKKEGGYRQIAYDAVSVSIEDFVDLDNDGKLEVIFTGFYGQGGTKQDSRTHNYFSYNVYEFDGYRLKNADGKYKGFPKFVWFTHKSNDKDSGQVTLKERQQHLREKEKGLVYKDIK